MNDMFQKLGSLNRYQWWVLVVAALGWLFDTMDQRLFVLARKPALESLLAADRPKDPEPQRPKDGLESDPAALAKFEKEHEAWRAVMKPWRDKVNESSTWATSIFMLGWATGGLFFGVIGDRWGRVFTMLMTILIYSAFTGLSAFATNWWDFAFYRFLSGVGVGGEFAAGVALVAEVMPNEARAYCLGLLQALSAVGNIAGSLVGFFILPLSFTIPAGTLGLEQDFLVSGWRIIFLVGILPALLIVLVRRNLEEPESWKQAQEAAQDQEANPTEGYKGLGSIQELLGDPALRANVLVGIALSVSGVIGLWSIGFFTPELLGLEALRGYTDAEKGRWSSLMLGLQDVGGFFGILTFSLLSAYMGRRPAFAIAFVAAAGVTVLVFGWLGKFFGAWDVVWMGPMIGFCNLAVFGGYAIYFPELFPTRLRSTGTGFCYNVSRYLAAAGPLFLGALITQFAWYSAPVRAAGMTLAAIYVVGLLVLPFAPETKDQPLPE